MYSTRSGDRDFIHLIQDTNGNVYTAEADKDFTSVTVHSGKNWLIQSTFGCKRIKGIARFKVGRGVPLANAENGLPIGALCIFSETSG